jgi:hypothetical protein
MCELEEFYGWE